MKHGKKYVEAAKLVDRAVAYEPAEAVALVKKTAVAKFDETIEVHIRTGCDGRHAEQQVRGAVVLPNGTGKTVKVLVFAKGDKVAEAEAAGADYVGGEELIPRIQEIKENAVNDFNLRIMKPLKNSPLEEEDKEKLMSAVDKAMEKVVNKMLFGLRDSMNEKAFLECVAGLEKTYEK